MPTQIHCPDCGEEVSRQAQEGEQAHCEKCGLLFLVGEPGTDRVADEHEGSIQKEAPRQPAPPEVARSRPSVPDRESKGSPQRPASSTTALWIILISLVSGTLLLGLLCVVVVVVWLNDFIARIPPPSAITQPPGLFIPAAAALDDKGSFFVANPSCLSLSADGKRLAVGSYDKTVRIFDVQTEKEIAVLAGHDEEIYSVSLSPDGSLLASGGKDQLVQLWDVARRERLHTLETKLHSPLVRFTPDGKTLVVARGNDGVDLLDVKTRQIVDTLKSGREVEAIDLTPDGKFLVLSSITIRIWDLSARRERVLNCKHRGTITAVALSADGKVVVTGSADATIKIWDVETGALRLTIPLKRGVVSMVMTPDARLLASSGSTEGTIRLWNAQTGKEVVTLDTFGPLLMGRDSKTLLTGVNPDWVKVWALPGPAEQ